MSEAQSIPPAVSSAELRTFAGHFATGVAVVTTAHPDGALHGLTLNAVTSLSLDPPLYLVCLDHRSNTLRALQASGHFAVHFLAREQAEISRIFASKQENKFADIPYALTESGSPLIADVLAAAECRLSEICTVGDHMIVIGSVQRIHVFGGQPLLYHRGGYTALSDERKAA